MFLKKILNTASIYLATRHSLKKSSSKTTVAVEPSSSVPTLNLDEIPSSQINKRDASNSFNGYVYQRHVCVHYSLYLLLNFTNTNQALPYTHIVEEGDEDVECISKEGRKLLIQCKYHKIPDYERLTKDSGLLKVIMANFENSDNIDEIYYVTNNNTNEMSVLFSNYTYLNIHILILNFKRLHPEDKRFHGYEMENCKDIFLHHKQTIETADKQLYAFMMHKLSSDAYFKKFVFIKGKSYESLVTTNKKLISEIFPLKSKHFETSIDLIYFYIVTIFEERMFSANSVNERTVLIKDLYEAINEKHDDLIKKTLLQKLKKLMNKK